MKMQFISLCGFLSLAPTLLAQTSFQDLDFESVTIVPLQDHWGRVSLSAALPGWLGYTGSTPLDRVQYNATFLDSTGQCEYFPGRPNSGLYSPASSRGGPLWWQLEHSGRRCARADGDDSA